MLKNYLTAIYPYIRIENSSTGCTSIHRGFCKMLWYCSILFYFESVRSIVNKKNNNNFTGLNVFFKALYFRFWQVSQNLDQYINQCKNTSILRIASHIGSNPVRGKPLFPWARNFTLIAQYKLVLDRNWFESVSISL